LIARLAVAPVDRFISAARRQMDELQQKGLIYTDAVVRRAQVKEAFRPTEDSYRPIVYPAAVVAGSRHRGVAEAFIELLLSPRGQAVLARHGFQPPPPSLR
jgi:molybdate transport system substrate-binding protein